MALRSLLVLPLVVAAVCAEPRRMFTRAAVCADSLSVSWKPDSLREGALFRVLVAGIPAGAQIAGSAAGEVLHFRRDSSDTTSVESLAGAPIDAGDSLGITIRCTVAEQTDSVSKRLMLVRATYPVERLRVAPAFGRPPDSAIVARTRREAARAADVAIQSHDTPRLWEQPFVRPRTSRVTSPFGGGREFNGTITSRHMGTDFAGATGAPVRAANRGVVRIVDAFYYGGNVVYVDHGAGVTSAYLHLSAQRVAPGDTVERGQVVGLVGATGRVTGPHLHFIVRYGRVTVDPLSLFAVAEE